MLSETNKGLGFLFFFFIVSLMYNYKIWLESLRAGLNTKILKRFSKK